MTAARSDARRVPTDRHRRRLAQRVRTVRRVSIEAALLVLAVAALVALRRRGVVSISGPADLALAAAPVLVAAAGALLLWRAVPLLLGGALRVARRSRKAGPLLAVARAGSTGAVLPFVALVVVTTLVALCGALAGTARAGQADGSWDTVGADVVVRTTLPGRVAAGRRGPAGRRRRRRRGRRRPGAGPQRSSSTCAASTPCGCSRSTRCRTATLLARTPFGAAPALAALADASGAATTRAVPGPLPALVPARAAGHPAVAALGRT